jgi:hypothetical protein
MTSNARAQRLVDEFEQGRDFAGGFSIRHGIAAVLWHLIATEADPESWGAVPANRLDALAAALTAPTPPPLPSGYIDPEHQGEDLALLETFYRACLAEGGTADEIELRGIRAVLATHSTPQPPADGEVAELVAELRHFIAEYQQFRGLDPENIYSLHQGDPEKEAHLRISRLTRATDLLQRQRPQPVAVSERLPEAGESVWHCYVGVRFWQHGRYNGRQFFIDDGPESQPATHWLPANALPTPEAKP